MIRMYSVVKVSSKYEGCRFFFKEPQIIEESQLYNEYAFALSKKTIANERNYDSRYTYRLKCYTYTVKSDGVKPAFESII